MPSNRIDREDSGRVLDLRPRGCRFAPHGGHCIVSLSKTNLSMLSTGSTQTCPNTEKLLNDWDVKNQFIQT